jgi:hypothetical protein
MKGRIKMKMMTTAHRVGRVLSFFSSRRNWDSPNPSSAGECDPPPGSGGEEFTRWRERGWESPNSDEGTYTVVLFFLYIRTLFLCHGRESASDSDPHGIQIRIRNTTANDFAPAKRNTVPVLLSL